MKYTRYIGTSIIVGVILFGMLWCSDPRMFGDRQRAVNAIYKYHETYGRYPENLDEVKQNIKSVKFKWSYSYSTDNKTFTLSYTGGLSDKGAAYDSGTQQWEELYY